MFQSVNCSCQTICIVLRLSANYNFLTNVGDTVCGSELDTGESICNGSDRYCIISVTFQKTRRVSLIVETHVNVKWSTLSNHDNGDQLAPLINHIRSMSDMTNCTFTWLPMLDKLNPEWTHACYISLFVQCFMICNLCDHAAMHCSLLPSKFCLRSTSCVQTQSLYYCNIIYKQIRSLSYNV